MPTESNNLFKGRPFRPEIILLCVRWYLACTPSLNRTSPKPTPRRKIAASTAAEPAKSVHKTTAYLTAEQWQVKTGLK